jgi:membrane protease YdiL (CAAX protease family)
MNQMNVRIDAPNNATSTAAAVRRRAEWVTASVWLAFAVAAFWARAGARAQPAVAAAALLLFTLLTAATLSFSITSWRERLRVRAAARLVTRLAVPLATAAAIVAYSAIAGLHLPVRATAYTAYLLVPALVAGARTHAPASPVQVLVAALCLWLPIEFRLLPAVALPPPLGPSAAPFAALATGLYLFLVARPIGRIGYTFLLTRRDVGIALAATAAFAIPGIAFGIATHFLAWHPRVNAISAAVAPFAIYLATAVPEEFLFRGLIQNALERMLGRAGLPVAAIVFGLAHLPDARYVLLATLAGFAYGWVYIRTRRITASAVTHALVDWIWVLLFRIR